MQVLAYCSCNGKNKLSWDTVWLVAVITAAFERVHVGLQKIVCELNYEYGTVDVCFLIIDNDRALSVV